MAKTQTPARWRLGALLAAVAVLPAACGYLPGVEPEAAQAPAGAAAPIVVDGAFNVRDLGGYTTSQGSTIVTGRIYRSSALNRVTDTGVAQLAELGILTVIDFRGTDEAAARADRVPDGVTVLGEPAKGASRVGPPRPGGGPDPKVIEEFRGYVTDASSREALGASLRYLADASGPVLWHCNSGTYRTGWASAVLLTALGVPREQVDEDFLLSNAALGATFAHVEYLDAAFAEADSLFGSFAGYLDEGLGVDEATLERLRESLLV